MTSSWLNSVDNLHSSFSFYCGKNTQHKMYLLNHFEVEFSTVQYIQCCETDLQNIIILHFWNCVSIKRLVFSVFPQPLVTTILLCFYKCDHCRYHIDGILQYCLFVSIPHFIQSWIWPNWPLLFTCLLCLGPIYSSAWYYFTGHSWLQDVKALLSVKFQWLIHILVEWYANCISINSSPRLTFKIFGKDSRNFLLQQKVIKSLKMSMPPRSP